MWYESYILPRAQRDIGKIQSKETQESVLKTCIDDLEENPRPYGYEPVKGLKGNTDLYRVYSDDRKFRIIYSIEDDLRAVIIVAVRRRREGTYKDIPLKSLSDKVKNIAQELKEALPHIRKLAHEMGMEWVPGLSDREIRCLDIGIEIIRNRRSSAFLVAEKIKETTKVNEHTETIVKDMKRLLKLLPSK